MTAEEIAGALLRLLNALSAWQRAEIEALERLSGHVADLDRANRERRRGTGSRS